MKYTEITQSIKDPSKVKESREYPFWEWNIMWFYRDIRCAKGLHKKTNCFGELLKECIWCGKKI